VSGKTGEVVMTYIVYVVVIHMEVIHTVVISLGIVANHIEVESSLLVYFDP
jgi:hypothetical protein